MLLFEILFVATLATLTNSEGSLQRRLYSRNCWDVLSAGHSSSGVYTIFPHDKQPQRPLHVYCDMETDGGGWTVIQQRRDITPRRDFFLTWTEYVLGFGNLTEEFWLGLDHIHALTDQSRHEIRIDLKDFEGEHRWAKYKFFYVHDKSDLFRLEVNGYEGDAGDGLQHHHNRQFSAKDKDVDAEPHSCAAQFKGGWWYGACHDSNLNGVYLVGTHKTHADGVNWEHWRGNRYSLKEADMKIRPAERLPLTISPPVENGPDMVSASELQALLQGLGFQSRNCKELQNHGYANSGIYVIYPFDTHPQRPLQVYCDMETDGGGWTVIQRRRDITPRRDFFLTWTEYVLGFGSITGEHWLGLDHIHALTDQSRNEIRIDLQDFEGERRWAKYKFFYVHDKSDLFRLEVNGYEGNAEDGLQHHHNKQFSAKDKDVDTAPESCAAQFKGGWWYGSCHDSNLNGVYLSGPHTTHADGVNWEHWKGNKYSLMEADMKIRPTI